MTESWKDRCTLTGHVLFGLALFGLLIWALLQQQVPMPRSARSVSIVTLIEPPIPQPPPPPAAKIIRPQIAKAPAPTASRPKLATPHPNSQPAPKSPAPAHTDALAMNTPLAADPFEIPHGADGGHVIGGGGSGGRGFIIGGGGGGGGECGRMNTQMQLERVNSEVVRRLSNDPTVNSHEFIARVRLWFDATGVVRQTEFEDSTGDSSVDELVATLLSTVDVEERVPECIQPVTVRLVSPWNARSRRMEERQSDDKTQQSQTLIWQRPPPR